MIRAGFQSESVAQTKALNLTSIVFTVAFFFIPMKALAASVGGVSVYLPYLALGLVGIVALKDVSAVFSKYFLIPSTVVLGYSLLYFALTGYNLSVFVFSGKILVTLLMAAMYVVLVRKDEGKAMAFLYAGSVVSIVYMVYQAISTAAFGTSLPFTTVSSLEIGRGISFRYGLMRVTGFTEEPSYIAVMLLGTLMLLRSYSLRTGEKQTKRMWVIGLGLLLCTSNSLFATLPLVIIFGIFSYYQIPFLFFVLFYLVNIGVTPYLINQDESFFARFSSYSQFLDQSLFHQIIGIGFNQYSSLAAPQFITAEGVPTLVVEALASLWGGVLLEGGVIFTVIFCWYVSKTAQNAKYGFGLAFVSILLMLANYYSPWWPIVSLALAYCVISTQPMNREVASI